jgi:hypothetical protein
MLAPAQALAQFQPLSIVTNSVPDATQYVGYEFPLEAAGGNGTYSWSMDSGKLPGGMALRLDESMGILTLFGAPTEAGSFNFTLKVADGSTPPQSATHDFTLLVTQTSQPLTTPPPAGGCSGTGLEPVGLSLLALLQLGRRRR